MPSISRQAIVPYTPQEMFDLVNDVKAYPGFLPGCRSSAVLSADEDEIKASIELAKGAVRKSFTTRNRLQRNKMIEMRLVDGPFRHLEGFWRFDALNENATRVSLDLEFEFSNRIMSAVIGPVFHQVANSLVDSFVKRARVVYGAR
ncbi:MULTISPECIES: type II toxin-antitoxin system RatA family toxin [Ectothiorhodospira]|uniref:type II toxin-antitoxin system RatA family toxin n=1 Tax=Ectothiorhodospira TaxID=1051 RepID=UPI001EE82F18|nr:MULTISPECIES: type II toxin-antitoxin system RatA family toxin [Ectothiorhodospira]MCG5493214.1 type II toxin-antitoxin system RatA family toxin [Ectothiorhodospira variabilis]MCG5497064.1 type II toxin-antitoxin system RatA family toxin [Ectothiorhodospira variabilis]MCG5502543.1 type II toxin-antitoxin system RatA family toxin [Ectothiorhodospira variabilis]MCG5505691.1 type II toxin-antitoxin system RatA family toxin [Ectothiorhodospira variabilis]MCG5525416.1 type II toxin-antitoxin sys